MLFYSAYITKNYFFLAIFCSANWRFGVEVSIIFFSIYWKNIIQTMIEL